MLLLLVVACANNPCEGVPVVDRPVLAAPSGSYTVGVRSAALVDPKRSDELVEGGGPREIAATTWYPSTTAEGEPETWLDETTLEWIRETWPGVPDAVSTNAVADAPLAPGPFPVVVFSPGLGMVSRLYTSLVEDVASRGAIVVAVDHPGVSGVVLRQDGVPVEAPSGPPDVEIAFPTVVADLVLALDVTLEDAAADPAHISAVGHSFGGAAALALCRDDERVGACVNLDGTLHGGVDEDGFDEPALVVSTRPDATVNRLFDRVQGQEVRMGDAGHEAFGDLGLVVCQAEPAVASSLALGSLDPWLVTTVVRDLLAAFAGLSEEEVDAVVARHPGVVESIR